MQKSSISAPTLAGQMPERRTLSSTVSHFVTSIPSMPRSFPPEDAEKSRSARSNLVSWSTASLPTSASPTKMILSGVLTATSCWDGMEWSVSAALFGRG